MSWGIALFEYLLQVPANRIGYAGGYSLAQLKIAQEVITLMVFVPFAVLYMQPAAEARLPVGRALPAGGGVLHLPAADPCSAAITLAPSPMDRARPSAIGGHPMLFGKLMPRDGNFFELFNEHGRVHRRRAHAPSWR